MFYKNNEKILHIFIGVFFIIFNINLSFANPASTTETEPQQTNFLSITDIHFDPFVACKHGPCPLAQKLQRASIGEWPKLLTQYDTQFAKHGQETNYPLFTSMLAAAQTVSVKNNIKFVVMLGDILRHDFRQSYRTYTQDKSLAGYQNFVKKTIAFLTQEFAKTFPSVDVYPVVGNNDSYNGDYYVKSFSTYNRDFSNDWGNLIRSSNKATFKKDFIDGGYYAVDVPNQPNLRLIVLNTVMFSVNARGKDVDVAAKTQLAWLQKELEAVKAKNQRALILMHIPTGIDVFATLRVRLFRIIELWKSEYRNQYDEIIYNAAPNIMGILAGHLHADWFQVMGFKDANNQVPLVGTPAVSPIFGNNPSFKMFSYSRSQLTLEDYVTYYYSLSSKNQWNVEYNFKQIYMPNCGNCSVLVGIKALTKGNHLADYYKRFYAVNTTAEPITTKWKPFYWCAIHENHVERYKKCITATP